MCLRPPQHGSLTSHLLRPWAAANPYNLVVISVYYDNMQEKGHYFATNDLFVQPAKVTNDHHAAFISAS